MADWKPIDTAPKDGTAVMLYLSKAVERAGYMDAPEAANRIVVGWHGQHADRFGAEVWVSTDVLTETFGGSELTGTWNEYEWARVQPTHWMPLPEPPHHQPEERP